MTSRGGGFRRRGASQASDGPRSVARARRRARARTSGARPGASSSASPWSTRDKSASAACLASFAVTTYLPRMDDHLTPAARRALAEAEARRKAPPPAPKELGGREGPEPVRYGDWELKGLAVDF
jgi:hypothetical protein